MSKEIVSITVFTPTYNRKGTLMRAYESLKKQTNKDFEWLIIDDGSTDGTDAMIKELIDNEKEFEIRYYWKENGGRHTAVNYSYQYIRAPYVVTLDSDDELVDDAIQKMIDCWNSIPAEEYDRFWCVSGREIDSVNREIVGKLYPEDINSLKGKEQRKRLLKIDGEKHCCRKTSVLVNYKFPVYEGTRFVGENEVWEQINRKYDQYCVNDVFGIYHTESPDGIVNGGMHRETMNVSLYHCAIFYINELFDEILYNKFVIIYILNISMYAMRIGIPVKSVLKEINKIYKKALVLIGYPVSAIRLLLQGNK